MALTVSITEIFSVGNAQGVIGTIAFDSSYPTGGEELLPATLGLTVVKDMSVKMRSGLMFDYDYTNSKVLAYVPGITVGAAGGHTLDDYDLEGVGATTSGYAIGLEASITQSTDMRFGLMKEVANGADLSTITGVRFFALGF